MQAFYTITAENDFKAYVTAYVLRTDESRPYRIKLSELDRFIATDNRTQTSVELTLSELDNGFRYEAVIPSGSSGTEYTLSLDRTESPNLDDIWFPDESVELPDFGRDFVSAMNTIITLPDSFSMQTDRVNFNSLQEVLVVTWDNSGTSDDMFVVHSSSCPEGGGEYASYRHHQKNIAGDTGFIEISINDLLEGQNLSSNYSCEISVSIVRERRGSADEVFRGDSVVMGQQKRSVTVFYRPAFEQIVHF